jgi:Tfp pilus assembly protein FimT
MPSSSPSSVGNLGKPHTPPPRRSNVYLPARLGFTLIELIAVMGIIVVMIGLIVPAVVRLNSAGNMNSTVAGIQGTLEEARGYAVANSTYTWVGFFEEDPTQTPTTPATPGIGRIVLSIVASKISTALNANLATPSPSGTALTPASLVQVDKLTKLPNAHVADFSQVATPTRTMVPDPYQVAASTFQNGMIFYYPPTASAQTAQYAFVSIIQFSPLGDATRISDTPQPLMEIGLRPTHGNVADVNTKDYAAIQITGIGGQLRLYRP